ncbi:MAG TPA: cobalamin biosynthesis protein P47K [Verrucomicrobiales bacterium]|nr:cobalamin biosynthesis protein P47K [Verrucomicrobiales bacterium]
MIGGFLGAGKTTAVSRLAQHLRARGDRVGLITNDQGSHLVDTAMLASRGFPVEEIAGGCFCCRFNSLTEAARKLSEATRPEVFVAEPVGSCTDLVATVTYPLRRLYGDRFTIAPLSVLIDPVRALRLFGLEPGGRFTEKVAYIYRKQLEEADLLVINKVDLLEAPRREALLRRLGEEFPGKKILEISAREGTGLEAWFNEITSGTQSVHPSMSVDYDVYAEGEALLGWLNATLRLRSPEPFDGNQVLRDFAAGIQGRLAPDGVEIAHLKMTLDAEDGLGDLAVLNLVRSDYIAELSQSASEPMGAAELVVNLRAEGAPGLLEAAVREAAARLPAPIQSVTEHLEHFRPGRPVPTHRIP